MQYHLSSIVDDRHPGVFSVWKRPVSFLYSIMLVLFAFSIVFADDDDLLRYGGKTLNEWKLVIKDSSFQELSNPQSVSALIEIISDRDVPDLTRRQVALTLGRIGDSAADALPVLDGILKSEMNHQPSVLWVLKSLALYELVAEDLTPQVAQIVSNVELPLLVRMQAIETLGKIGSKRKESVATFIDVLRATEGDTSQKELRMVAADGLWLLGEAASPALPELIRTAQDPWPLARLTAVTSIGQIGPLAEIAIPTLVDTVLFDDAGEVREAAADALGGIGDSSLPAFKQLSTDQDPTVRRLAIRGLKQLRSALAEQLLLQRLKDQTLIVRIEAARMLLLRGDSLQSAVPVLLQGLESEEREVRITAYRSLQQHPTRLEPYRRNLETLTESTHAQTCKAAEQLLRSL